MSNHNEQLRSFPLTCLCIHLQLIVEGRVLLLLATSALVHLGGDGVGDVGQLLLLLLKVLGGGVSAVLLEPLGGLLDSVEDLGMLACGLLSSR